MFAKLYKRPDLSSDSLVFFFVKKLKRMKHIKEINELKISDIITHDSIVEEARINNKIQFPYDVFVNGGDFYGLGRNEHGNPHFHFADNIKGGDWQFSILIPTVEEWIQNKELYIYESSNGEFNWKGLNKEKKMLIEWMDKLNVFDDTKTNLEFIRLQWNVLNIDNKNVKQIKKIK